MNEYKVFLLSIIKESGNIALKYWKRLEKVKTYSKGSNVDIVSEVDYKIESYIRAQINNKFPFHSIYGEEKGVKNGNKYRWIIDPIDGTVSFLHGQFHWCISIAFEINNKVVLGAIYCPCYDYLFFAEKDQGATLNNKRIIPSKIKELKKACVCTGFCCIRSNWKENNLIFFNEVATKVQGIRRLGSIATDIAFVACGKLDACWEMNVNLYDVAAALLIAKEAGCLVFDMNGSTKYLPNFPLVTNPYLKDQILNIFESHNIPFKNRR